MDAKKIGITWFTTQCILFGDFLSPEGVLEKCTYIFICRKKIEYKQHGDACKNHALT
jgi:hypothetical protein